MIVATSRTVLPHLCFFEALGARDEHSVEYQAIRAGLLLLRELDEIFTNLPPRASIPAQALREAVATVARTSPMRAPMEGIVGQLERGGVRSAPQPLFVSLVALGKAANRVLGPRVAADVFDSVRSYAKDCDPGAAREAERWIRRLPHTESSTLRRH